MFKQINFYVEDFPFSSFFSLYFHFSFYISVYLLHYNLIGTREVWDKPQVYLFLKKKKIVNGIVVMCLLFYPTKCFFIIISYMGFSWGYLCIFALLVCAILYYRKGEKYIYRETCECAIIIKKTLLWVVWRQVMLINCLVFIVLRLYEWQLWWVSKL